MSNNHLKLELLFKNRFHGAGNHRGALYHSLYGCLLGLRIDGSLCSKLGTERYEDLEIEAQDGSLTLYQLKCEAQKLDYGKLEKILRSFAEVILEKEVTDCCIVTATGYPIEVENWLVDPKKRKMPAKLKERIKNAAEGNSHVDNVLFKHLRLVTVETDELCRQVSQTIVTRLDVSQAAHESFLHALAFQMQSWSGQRAVVSSSMIAKVLADVQSQFDAGLTNPAIAQGFVVPVTFRVNDPAAEDFYEGRAARAGHIAAHKDVLRLNALRDLENALQASNVAAVISSSGQGKSALALRYIADHTTEDFVYEVKVCRSAEDAAAIAQFVRFRVELGLEVSLFIDNLSRAHGAWNELASALAGERVKILVTAREEDWKLFAGDLSHIGWKRMTPTLELAEARQIFQNLRSAGKIAPSIPNADEAYARVSEAKLLIEYVYLLTQGELMEVRLQQQVADLDGRDPGAVECLRIVSLADQMNLSVEASHLLETVNFKGDGQLALQRLEGEYLVVQDGLCSGLHPVRSQHLVTLLHPYGIESTLKRLIAIIDDEALLEFTYSLLARTSAQTERVADALVKRFAGKVAFQPMWESAYAGSEVRHAQSCLPLLDDLEQKVGRACVNLFPLLTPPFLGESGFIETMRDIVEPERFEVLERAIKSVPPREYEQRFEAVLATKYAQIRGANDDIRDSLALAKAFWLIGKLEQTDALLMEIDWQGTILTLPLPLALRTAFLAQQAQPEGYDSFIRERYDDVVSYLLRETQSLFLTEEDGKMTVAFIVDPYSDVRDNEQAVYRVQSVRGLLPGFEAYATEPVRPLELPIPLPYDDGHKDGPIDVWHSEEYTSLNKRWGEAMEVVTSSDSLVGWEWTQREAIHVATGVLRDLAEFFERQDQKKWCDRSRVDAYESRSNLLEQRKEARRNLPSSLDEKQKDALKAVDELFDAAHSLRGSLSDELVGKDEGESNRKQVILYGLRAVHTFAHPAEEALDSVRRQAGLDDGESFTDKLRNVAERLYRSIERRSQKERRQSPLDSLSASTAHFLHAKLSEVDSDLAKRVRLADKVLLYTPGSEAERFGFPSLLFTLEVEELDAFVTDAVAVCMVFADAFDSFWGNLIVVPVRHGKRVSTRMYRALAPTLRDVLAGEEPEGLIVWPMDVESDLSNTLFNLEDHQPRPELDLVQRFLEAGEKYAYAKAASLIEASTPESSKHFSDRIVAERLEEAFQGAANSLRNHKAKDPLVNAWNDILHAVEAHVAVIEANPDQFLMANSQLSEPLDRYFSLALSLEDS